MDRRQLEIKKLVERLGLQIKSLKRPRGGHYKVVITDGKEDKQVIFPSSASDYRWTLNKKSQLKNLFHL